MFQVFCVINCDIDPFFTLEGFPDSVNTKDTKTHWFRLTVASFWGIDGTPYFRNRIYRYSLFSNSDYTSS